MFVFIFLLSVAVCWFGACHGHYTCTDTHRHEHSRAQEEKQRKKDEKKARRLAEEQVQAARVAAEQARIAEEKAKQKEEADKCACLFVFLSVSSCCQPVSLPAPVTLSATRLTDLHPLCA